MKKTNQFCPLCGKKLVDKGKKHKNCVCGFIDYQNSRPGVGVLILNDKNELLLAKRSMDPGKGQWNTIGGFLESGEKPEDGAIREAKEETGLDIELGDLIDIVIGDYDDPYQGFFYTLNLYYEAKICGGKLKTDHESSTLKFFPLDKLPKIAFFADSHAIKTFLDKFK